MTSILVVLSIFACTQPKADPAPAPAPEPAVETEGAAAEVAEVPGAMVIPERADEPDRVSKNGHVVHKVGDVTVDIRFGKPQVKGRTIWGDLVPYGQIWRTGANEATTVAFDGDVTVEGQALPAGVYSFFTIPGEETWTVIFNREAKQWGSFKYAEGEDALRVTVTPSEAEPAEEMVFEGTDEGFVLRWAELAVPVKVSPAG